MVFLKTLQISQENICAGVSFLVNAGCIFIKKDALAQAFLGEVCEIFKNTCFIEPLWEELIKNFKLR